MRTFASPTFVSSTSSRMEVAADTPMATEKQLRIQPYLCVSYDKEEDFYQPLRLVNTVFVGPALMAAASKVNDPLLKGITAVSGLFLMVTSGVRFYEAYEEMTRYTDSVGQREGGA
jgi:hypothetical protein